MGNSNGSEGASGESEVMGASSLTREQSLEAMNAKLASKPFGNVGMERIGDKKILTQFFKLFYKGMKVKLYMYGDEEGNIECFPAVLWYRKGFFHWLDEDTCQGAWEDEDVTSFRERDIAFVQKGCTSHLFMAAKAQNLPVKPKNSISLLIVPPLPMVAPTREVEGGEDVEGVEGRTLKLEKGQEYVLVERQVRNKDEQNTSYSRLRTVDGATTGLVLVDDYAEVPLNQSEHLKSMQSNPRETYTMDMEFDDDEEGTITRAIAQGFSLIGQKNEREVQQTEKSMMNGYNHKNRLEMRLPKDELKTRRGSASSLIFGPSGATKGASDAYEPHIAPTYPIACVTPSPEVVEGGQFMATSPAVFAYNHKIEDLEAQAEVEQEKRFSLTEQQWTAAERDKDMKRRSTFAKLDTSTIFDLPAQETQP